MLFLKTIHSVDSINTIYLIRHAEKTSNYFNQFCKDQGNTDKLLSCMNLIPPLNMVGLQRANELEKIFSSKNIKYIYVPNYSFSEETTTSFNELIYVRPWQTVYPLSDKLKIEINTDVINLNNILTDNDTKIDNIIKSQILNIINNPKLANNDNILICSEHHSLAFIISALCELTRETDVIQDLTKWPKNCFDIVFILKFKNKKIEKIICTGQFIFKKDSTPYQIKSAKQKSIFYDKAGSKVKPSKRNYLNIFNKNKNKIDYPVNTLIAQKNENLEKIRDNYNFILKKYNNNLPVSLYEYLKNYNIVKFSGTN